MSLAMQRTSLPSSGSTGAMKPSRAYGRTNSVGTSSSSTYGSSTRMPKQTQSFSSRTLPKGPGPLPDKYIPDKSGTRTGSIKYVAASGATHQKSYGMMDSSTARRKTSNDSGYASSSTRNSYAYGDLRSGKSKSLSQLNSHRDDLLRSPSNRRRMTMEQSVHGVSSRTGHSYTQNHVGTKAVLNGGSNTKSSSTSIYQSTTHLDYRDPKQERKSLHNGGQSYYSSHKDLSNAYTTSGKDNYSVRDVDKTRKATITALPGSDMKCARNSSFSSSNSSSPNSPTGRSSSDGLVGLRNLGNTCFMNSILQCLSHTKPLTDTLLKGSLLKNINSSSSMKGKLIQAFAELIKSMWKQSSSDAVSPHSFKTQIQRFAPRFMGYNQQDAQEFLRFLLEGLHDDLNQVKSQPKYTPCEFDASLNDHENAEKSWKNYLSRDNSLMTDLFVGQLKSMLKCCDCGHTSITFDPFWDLSLPIPRKSRSWSSSSIATRSSMTDDDDINLIECIQSFTKEEVLDGDERPTCDKCKHKRKSTKKFSIQRFPSILVLHLKRFSGFSFRSKLLTNVDFPQNKLDLSGFAADPQDNRSAVYSLYAVSNHSGGTYGGHYTAYCKHPVSNQWHCFNDSRVDSLPSSRVRGSQAYILFYKKMEPVSSL